MQIQTLKELKNTFSVNNELSVPKDSSNTDYQAIQKYIAEGGDYESYNSLSDAKEEKKNQLKANRQAFQYSNFVFEENIFKASESAQNKLANKIQTVSRSGDTLFSWNDAADEVVALELSEAQALLAAIIEREDSAYSKYAEKLKEIDACEDLEKLGNININFN